MTFLRQLAKSILPPPVTIRLRAAFKQHEPEIWLLPALCDPARGGLDIGAALGAYSWPMAKYCAHCIAFEPNPEQARYLRKAFGSRLRVENLALSDRNGETALLIPIGSGNDLAGQATVAAGAWLEGQPVRRVNVAMRRLDGFELEQVGFIKLDVEGHELAVLEGGHKLLARDEPNLLVELEERFGLGSIARVRGYLEGLGYRGIYLDGGKLRPIARFEPARDQQSIHWGDRTRYINNFIFIGNSCFEMTCKRLSRLGYAIED